MKLVAISFIKNEADVVEAFARHSLALVDQHLIFDHDSTDGTREILAELAREGKPVALFTADAIGKFQQPWTNELMRIAARDCGADWILPLDADEFLVTTTRDALEKALGDPMDQGPASIAMVNFYPAAEDDRTEANPVLRIRHRVHRDFVFRKVIIPRALALDPAARTGPGGHAVLRENIAVPDRPAPPDIYLAHFPQRSLEQLITRIVTGELQKLSRGSTYAGLDTHYRPIFEFLQEHPDLFPETLHTVPGRTEYSPIQYRGGELRYTSREAGWMRTARALLPFLEKLARSHGDLVDRIHAVDGASTENFAIRPIPLSTVRAPGGGDDSCFSGFVCEEGLGPPEGPFVASLLPKFRWAMAPRTVLRLDPDPDRVGRLEAEVITYTENELMTIQLNGAELLRLAFGRIDQKERIVLPLPLAPGVNQLVFEYERFTQTEADPRKLAVIFLSLRVV